MRGREVRREGGRDLERGREIGWEGEWREGRKTIREGESRTKREGSRDRDGMVTKKHKVERERV